MSKRQSLPKYRHHKARGLAVVTLPMPDGTRRDVYLGKHGTPESWAEYQRVVGEWQALGRTVAPAGTAPPSLTVVEVAAAFVRHAGERYKKAGVPTSEVHNIKAAVRRLREAHGFTPVARFGPLALEDVKAHMIRAGATRSAVNRALRIIRRMFKWAAARELVPADVWHRLQVVPGVRKGQGAAPDAPPVGPVADADLAATLPHLSPTLAAMARVQRLTGMRPGEVCRLRPADIDRAGDVWVYVPAEHKTEHHGKDRRVPIGPKARAVLEPLLPADPAAFVFSPRMAVAGQHAARSAARKTKLYPSHARRNAEKRTDAPARPAGERYTVGVYGRAVSRAVRKANARRLALAGPGNFDPVADWSPNMLRHAFASEVRKRFGLEAAQVLLGHAKADVTQVYAERDMSLAGRVAAEVG